MPGRITPKAAAEFAAVDAAERDVSRTALLSISLSIDAALALARHDARGCHAYAADLDRLGPDAITGLLVTMKADAGALRDLAALVEMGEARLLCGAARFLAGKGAR